MNNSKKLKKHTAKDSVFVIYNDLGFLKGDTLIILLEAQATSK